MLTITFEAVPVYMKVIVEIGNDKKSRCSFLLSHKTLLVH